MAPYKVNVSASYLVKVNSTYGRKLIFKLSVAELFRNWTIDVTRISLTDQEVKHYYFEMLAATILAGREFVVAVFYS